MLLYDFAHACTNARSATLQKNLNDMNDFINQTLGEIVTRQNNTVSILEKHNLDYCCKGKRTLQKACEENNVDLSTVLIELQNVSAIKDTTQMPFTEMTAEQLINHILVHHHYYIKQIAPQIEAHLSRLFEKHRGSFEWIEAGFETFQQLKNELLQHIQKEEAVLFPGIKKVEEYYNSNGNKDEIKNILVPIMVMESEHAEAGALMEKLKTITNNYTPAQNACTTHRITLMELKEFEENLHQHVHLENNILFPKAIEMYNQIEAV
jgi:regulator of cell morphogenesis and NO signaling